MDSKHENSSESGRSGAVATSWDLYFHALNLLKNFFFPDLDSQGRLGGVDTDKWDNHNAIASGWKTVESNYRPVTFRKIYGVNKQMPPSVTPTPTSTLQRPAKQKETLPGLLTLPKSY